ncbi:Myosin 3, partial [Caligus rogercresseyi]
MTYSGVSKILDLDALPDPTSKFSLSNLIGEGTFGEVYEATITDEPERRVAIKIVENILDNIEEIEQEYTVLSTHWFHPNIPHFEGLYLKKEYGGDQIWMVMDLCDGGSVTDLMEALRDHRLPGLSEEEICYILSELVDYGIACTIKHTLDKRHTSVGTPYWMAPEVISCEQLKTHEYDSRCDVWSLGITAIELAEGRAPLLISNPSKSPTDLLKIEMWSEEFGLRTKALHNGNHRASLSLAFNYKRRLKPLNLSITKAIKLSLRFVEDFSELSASVSPYHYSTILTHLEKRYRQNKIYTFIGEIIVSINPCKPINIYNPHEMCKYRNKSKYDNIPHVFSMANSAFVISGESGSGKTMSANWAMKMLVYLGKAPNRNLEEKILQINPILEAFGNAKTPLNGNSSRFAKNVEITYSLNGKVTGARISVFLLEHSRVTSSREVQDDCNFHIFYYLVKGLNHYELSDKYNVNETHRFLGDQVTPALKDYDNFVAALKSLGFRDSDMCTIYNVIASILNIGDLDFTSVQTKDNVEGCKNIQLLGINKGELEDCFQNITVSAKGEVITRSNSPEEAKSMRDALAKGIYSRFFDYIVFTINKLLSYSLNVYGESSCIGILDIFGFETLETNSFEQLCINTTNEQLFYFFNQAVFRMEKEEYACEGVFAEMDGLKSNHEILDLLLSKPLGLFALIDEECKFLLRQMRVFSPKLNSNLTKFEAYSHPKQEFPLFLVNHYANKNRNFLPPELITVMRYSQNEVVRFLFSCPITKTGRLSCTSNLAPVTPDPSKMGGACSENHSQTRSQQTLSTFFRYSLTDLLKHTLNGTPHFIKCFRPNKTQKPGNLDSDYLMKQLKYSGIFQTVQIRQVGFPCRLTFAEFLRRYCFLGFSFDERVVATKENCQILMLRLRMDGYALGKTKVFLKYYHVEYLSKMYEYQIRKIIKVQGMINTQRIKWTVVRDLMLSKRFFFRWNYRVKTNLRFKAIKASAALEIQRHIRGYIARKKIGPLLAEKIQKMVTTSDTSAEKIDEITSELKDEGLTENEAAKFIQT